MPRPKNADAEATRRRILEAACDVLVEQGPSGLSSRAVARRADVSPALVNHYFTDRDGLVATVLDTVYRGIHGIADDLFAELTSGARVEDIIEEATLRLYRHARAHRPYVRVIVSNAVITGALDAQRQERTETPLFAAAARLFSGMSPHNALHMRLALKSVVMLIARYAAFSDQELEALTESSESPALAIEAHLVSTTKAILALHKPTANAE